MGAQAQSIILVSNFFKIMDVFIPDEILKIKDLNITEKVVLAIYKYYTEQGKYKCCSLSKHQIANELGISVDYMKDIKKHLVKLGYIRTDGGIKVIYLGVQVGDITPTSGGYNTRGGGYNTHQVGDITPSEWGIYHPHKKEKKEKEEIKKKKEEPMTNLDLLLDRLPDDYKTPEIVEYIKNNYLDKIDQADFSDGGVLDSYVVGLKSELLKRFTIYSVIDKPTPIRKIEEDDFMF